jgi:hypothetical protein
VDGQVQAILGAQGDGRLRIADFFDRRAAVEVFLAVSAEGVVPPRGGFIGDVELGQRLADLDVFELRLVWKCVAEPDAVVVHAEHHLEAAPGAIRSVRVTRSSL